MKNAAEEKSPGTSMRVAPSRARPSTVAEQLGTHDGHTESAKHALGMVPRTRRLEHAGLALRLQAREQQGRLDLCARHFESVLRAFQRAAAANGDRRLAHVGAHVRTHAPQRRRDTLHRPRHQGCIADQDRVEALTGQQPCQEAHGGT